MARAAERSPVPEAAASRFTLRLVLVLALALLLSSSSVVGLGAADASAVAEAPIATDAMGRRGSDEHAESREYTIESFDGVELAATLWYDPARENESRPVILAAHGWSQDRGSMEATARWLVDEGYLVLAWDARGFGESGGTVGLNGPDEWGDVSAIIDWLAEPGNLGDARVRLDEGGDPRLGMVGASYGGAIQLLASAQDPRIDAVVPQITWNDLVQSLAPGGVVKRGWVDLLYGSGLLASLGLLNEPPAPNAGGMDERLTAWFAEAAATGRLPGDAVEPLLERSPRTHNPHVRAHALIAQGWHDTLFPPDEAVANYQALKEREDRETHLLFYPGGHGHETSEELNAQIGNRVSSFLARHLLAADVQPLPDVIAYETANDRWTALDDWPPLAPHASQADLATQDGETTATLALSPAPTSHTDTQQLAGQLPSLQEDLLDDGPLPTALRLETGLLGPLTLHGNPRLELSVTPEADDVTLFFSLVETHDDEFSVLYNQVTPVRIEEPPGQPTQLNVSLPSLAHTVPGGTQLQLRVTTSDSGYHSAREAGSVDLALDDAVLTLPLVEAAGLRATDPEADSGQTQAAPGPGVLIALLLLIGAVGIARGRPLGRMMSCRL